MCDNWKSCALEICRQLFSWMYRLTLCAYLLLKDKEIARSHDGFVEYARAFG